ncbi:hypothetical protein LTR70_009646 [Exophiala xenobiotica]|uniref:Heterokaryon incompatibility domain-containing protein n=1 Tax=Lithohypha guttulata TaxID=1690604 RepID=A0ABR0JXN5_9EURO|nr:hypothetical protein LTR24_009341 [Lithohypha guttulata]KAK5310237.1 hypothetical protein LTR70_009646 [Exophiala xenobiotica]
MPPEASAADDLSAQHSGVSQDKLTAYMYQPRNQAVQLRAVIDADFEPPSDHLCSLCLQIVANSELLDQIALRQHIPPSHHEEWPHHLNVAALLGSADQGCHLCSLLYVQCCSTLLEEPQCASGLLKLHIGSDDDLYGFSFGLDSAQGQEASNSLLPVFAGPRQWEERNSPSRTHSTSSKLTLELAHKWLLACQSDHEDCSRQGFFPRGGPKRLLLLSGSYETPFIRLSEQCPTVPVTTQQPAAGPSNIPFATRKYLTLSHCWGKKPHLTLIKKNHKRFLLGLPFEDLPQTFRDAVSITIRLGYNALWIDALCIIQDDPQDIGEEIPRMGIIYGNSVCTIAALSSGGSDGGCFAQRIPLARVPCQLWTRSGHFISLKSVRMDAVMEQLDPNSTMGSRYAPQLHTRGWVVQERALSPRTLYFSKTGIHWECCSMITTESSLEESHRDLQAGCAKGLKSFQSGRLKFGIGKILRDSEEAHRLPITGHRYNRAYEVGSWHDQWWHLIALYTRCSLTHIADRWAGVNGIWCSRFSNDIFWKPHGLGQNRQTRRRLDNGFPSWSWLAIDSCVSLDGHALSLDEDQYIASVLSITVSPYCVTIEAPMSRIPKREELKQKVLRRSSLDSSSSSEYEWATDTTIADSILMRLCQGHWSADIPYDEKDGDEDKWSRHWLEREDIWALQWMLDERSTRLLVVRPLGADHSRWQRIGQYHFWPEHDDNRKLEVIGKQKLIKLY